MAKPPGAGTAFGPGEIPTTNEQYNTARCQAKKQNLRGSFCAGFSA
jgi:hypothetical protein